MGGRGWAYVARETEGEGRDELEVGFGEVEVGVLEEGGEVE